MTSFNFKRHEIESKRFLLVDDFGDMRSMLRMMLNSIGVRAIDTANNGVEAIAALAREHYDIVLCDYNLGRGKNGQDVLEEARYRRLIGLDAIFVMLTAENTREWVMGAVEYEPDSYLTKPFTKDLLKSRLERLILKRQDLQQVAAAVSVHDYPAALRILDEKIAGQPQNLGELTRQKAEILYRAGEYRRAEVVYQQVLATREMTWARLGLGKTFYATGRLEHAARLFQGLLQENQRLTAAYDWLARTQQALGRWEEAQQVLQQALIHSPKSLLRQRALGDLALKNGDTSVADQAFTEALKLGRNSVYKAPLIYVRLAWLKSRSGRAGAALKIVDEMEREFNSSDEARLYASLTRAMVEQHRGSPDEARRLMRQTEALYAALGANAAAEQMLEMARSYAELGELGNAQTLLEQVICNNHDDRMLLQQVEALIAQYALAVDAKRHVASIRREIVKLNNRGVKLAKTGRYSEALRLFSDAVATMPDNKVVNLNAARVMIMTMHHGGIAQEQLARVRDLLDHARTLDPAEPALHQVQQMYRDLMASSA